MQDSLTLAREIQGTVYKAAIAQVAALDNSISPSIQVALAINAALAVAVTELVRLDSVDQPAAVWALADLLGAPRYEEVRFGVGDRRTIDRRHGDRMADVADAGRAVELCAVHSRPIASRTKGTRLPLCDACATDWVRGGGELES
jgi:hypothetical protein